MDKEEYYFYEWLIIEKKMSKENFSKITNKEFIALRNEYNKFCSNLKG